MILNPTSGGSASVAAAVRAVEVKNGEAVNAGQFVQIQREGITMPVFNSVLTFPAERTAICALSETKLVAFYAATENSAYNLYATVSVKMNGIWEEGAPVLIKSVATGQGYATYIPVSAVKVSENIIILDTSEKGSNANYRHEVMALSVGEDNVITAGQAVVISTGSSSVYWVSSNAILEYAGEYNALFHCSTTQAVTITEADRSGKRIAGITVDPLTLAITAGNAYNYLADYNSSASTIYKSRYANAIHLADNLVFFALAYYDQNNKDYRLKIAVIAVNNGGVTVVSTKTSDSLTDEDMPCLFKINNSDILILHNKKGYKVVLTDNVITTFSAISDASVAPALVKNPTLKTQVDDTTTMYIWNASTYMRAQLFHVTDIDTPVSADTYIAVSDSLGNGTDNTAKATSSGRKIWFLTSNLYLNEADIVPTEYAYPCYDRIDGVAKTGGNGGDIINVYVPEA